MIWLALAVACSVAIAVIFKVGERRGFDRVALLTVNYAVAGVLSALLLGGGGGVRGPAVGAVALGVATGVLFIGGFYVFAVAIRAAGMGLATGVMRLSVVLPFLASWLIWAEEPSGAQLVGLALAGAAFFLLARPAPGAAGAERGEATRDRLRAAAVLGLLFLAGGLADVSMKTFGEVYAATHSRALFLLFVFGVAFLVGLGLVVAAGLRTGRWPRREAYAWGAALGLVNYGSADFILRAIGVLDGTFVFPANSVAIMLGAVVLGAVVWGERLTRANGLGLVLAALALALLAPG